MHICKFVSENSRNRLTIITHKGLFRYTKLPEGVSTGPGDFQPIMETVLQGISNMQVYLDNIFCTGTSNEIHLNTLHKVFGKLEQNGFKLNIFKREFFQKKIEILGFRFIRSHRERALNYLSLAYKYFNK